MATSGTRATKLATACVALVVASGFAATGSGAMHSGLAVADNPVLVSQGDVTVNGGDGVHGTEWRPAASRQPSYDPDQSLGHLLFTVRIPSIGVDEVVRAGMDLAVIDQGVAHWVGTAGPGQLGNMVLAGHRTTHTRPFYALDQLVPGDLVYVSTAAAVDVMYRVTETFIVAPDEVWITYDNGEALLTMFACHPKGSAAQRIVVRAALVANRLIG